MARWEAKCRDRRLFIGLQLRPRDTLFSDLRLPPSSSSSWTLLEVDKRNWTIESDKSNKT